MDLLELFNSIDVAAVQSFVSDRQEETLHLDFKQVSDPGMSRRDTRRNFAVAVSGFANSDGGVVIWGVSARADDDGVDCAQELSPIQQLSLYVSKLQRYSGDAVSPMADGVIHVKLPLNGDTGFVKSLIPASDSGPHMAKLGEDRYFKRSGSNFVKMEHFDIEDMFGRRARPHLQFGYRLRSGSVTTFSRNITRATELVVFLRNTGRGGARAPYVAIRVRSTPYQISRFGLDGNGNEGLPRLAVPSDSRWKRYGGGGDVVIHPFTEKEVTIVSCQFGADDAAVVDLELDYEVAAEGSRLETGTLAIPAAELIGHNVK
ncbi:MAG: ATP-binding protein [Chloroflexi bacterium]|nr:ATP-binding protein [Chloroflexota bacterium]